jgi:hypothetical protein
MMTRPSKKTARRFTTASGPKSIQKTGAGTSALLTDLPNELLDAITRLVGDDDLLALAVLCKRLNCVAIEIYHARMGINGVFLSISDLPHSTTSFHALKGIRLSFKSRNFLSITCYFSSNFIGEMKEVQRTLTTISTLNTIALNFTSMCNSLSVNWMFSSSLSLLLDALQGKSCNSLELTGNGTPIPYQTIFARPLVDLKCASLISIPEAITDWVTPSLNTSQITKFHLCDKILAATKSFLASLDLPSLLDFHISSWRHSVRDLITFLGRHPSITSLHVELQTYHLPQKSCICPLPNLHRLASTPKFVAYWLSSADTAPNITTLEFLPPAKWRIPSRLYVRSLREAFGLIAKRPGIHSLSLALEACPEMDQWLKVGRHPRAASLDKRPLPHITRLSICEAAGVLNFIPSWLRLFPNLDILVIDGFLIQDLRTQSQKTRFARQIHGSCPTLKTISFGLLHTPIAQWLAEDEIN